MQPATHSRGENLPGGKIPLPYADHPAGGDSGPGRPVIWMLRHKIGFLAQYRRQAFAEIQTGNFDLGEKMLQNIFYAQGGKRHLHFDPAELKIWTLATKYRPGRVHDALRAGMILLFKQILADLSARGKKLPPAIVAYLTQHSLPAEKL